MVVYDVVVAGAGLWGCTIARVLAEANFRVLVLEERKNLGGNCRTEEIDGIEVHTYGSHIFHTHLPEVWRFVNRFADFNGYQHKVLACHEGKTYFLPLGLALINSFYGRNLRPYEVEDFIRQESAGCQEPRNFEEQAISFIGKPLYDAFIRNYTMKQWGTDPRNLDAAIIKRLPVRASYDINYFPDLWQGIPTSGYNALFKALIDHPLIELRCGVDYLSERVSLPRSIPTFYSGPIDRFFGFKFGALPWRSLRFERENLDVADFQGSSVVNYVDADVSYTRVHEFKHFHPERKDVMALPKTIVCREYPQTWRQGDEPYYPVNNPESAALLARYQEDAAKIPNLVIGGRLGEYKYYDMDQSIGRALEVAKTWLGGR